MDALRIILIILGVAVIVAIYLWDRHQQKQALHRRIVSMPEQDDEPGIVITTRTQYDDDVSADLADLRHYMERQDDINAPEGDMSDNFFTTTHHDSHPDENHPVEEAGTEPSELTATDNGLDELSPQSADSNNTASPESVEHIVSLHIIARDPDKLSGADIRDAVESSGFVFGEMDIYHYLSDAVDSSAAPMFSLADMYEPGYFDIDHMDSFSTRGISVFARFDADNPAVTGFEIMLDTTRKLAGRLDAELLGPDRKPLDAGAVDNIRRRLRGEAG